MNPEAQRVITSERLGQTPADLGYHMPAEWEPHLGTWLSWPHNEDTWPDELDRVEAAMVRFVQAVSRFEAVFINVSDARHERHVVSLLEAAGVQGQVRLLHIPTNDAWVRDHGAIFVVRTHEGRREVAATNWGFNSWGGKYPPFDLDNEVPARMARELDLPLFDGGMILEGGSIEVNGAGVLLTTEACLLNPNRNPHLTREAIEERLRRFFGVQQILWLRDGIVGDDTDGHIDDITRFVREDTVLTVVEEDPQDDNYDVLQENLEALRGMTLPDGRPLQVLTLPMPRPVYSKGDRMPASYANYYVANGCLLVPAYNDPADVQAQRILHGLFPGREVVPIDCADVIWGLGAIHCLTQQIPLGASGSPAPQSV